MRSWILAAAAFALAANAAVAAEVPAEWLASIHTISIISALGNDVDMRTFGTMRWDNAEYTLHSDWNLDSLVVDDVAKALTGRFQIKSIAVDSQSIAAAALTKSHWHLYHPSANVQPLIAALPKGNGIDAYIVVYPVISVFMATDWQGITVTRSPNIIGRGGATSVAIYYEVAVYDTAGDVIGVHEAIYPARQGLDDEYTPKEFCSNKIWSDSADTLTVDQRSRLHREAAALINRSIAYTLASMNLLSEADAKTATSGYALEGDSTCKLRQPNW